MKQIYEKSYNEIKNTILQDGKGCLSSSDIQDIITLEENKFKLADAADIPVEKITKNNPAYYCKHLIRKRQPFYPVYLLLNIASKSAYLMLFFAIIKSCYFYFAGNRNAFTELHSYSFSLLIILLLTITDEACFQRSDKLFGSGRDNLAKSIKNSYLIIYTTAFIAAVLYAFIYNFYLSHIKIMLSLPTIFLFTVAVLFISGIHNVIYNSHFMAFFEIGILFLERKPAEEVAEAVAHYKSLCCQEDEALQKRLKSNRIYYTLALFIALVLDIVCIREISTGNPDLRFVTFLAAAVVISIMLLTAVISCNNIIKSIK